MRSLDTSLLHKKTPQNLQQKSHRAVKLSPLRAVVAASWWAWAVSVWTWRLDETDLRLPETENRRPLWNLLLFALEPCLKVARNQTCRHSLAGFLAWFSHVGIPNRHDGKTHRRLHWDKHNDSTHVYCPDEQTSPNAPHLLRSRRALSSYLYA